MVGTDRCKSVPRSKLRGQGLEEGDTGAARRDARPARPGSKLGPDGLEDRARLRKLAGLQFGINLFPIDAHFKRAAPRRHQAQRTQALFEAQKFFRQTDGFGFIVSSRAVFDCDFGGHDQFFALREGQSRRMASGRQDVENPGAAQI
jgi:hypothetical protein